MRVIETYFSRADNIILNVGGKVVLTVNQDFCINTVITGIRKNELT